MSQPHDNNQGYWWHDRYSKTRLSRTLLFWIAFVLTRPFSATMGDLMTKPVAKGGMDRGTIGSSTVLLAVLIALILWSRAREKVAVHPAS